MTVVSNTFTVQDDCSQ